MCCKWLVSSVWNGKWYHSGKQTEMHTCLVYFSKIRKQNFFFFCLHISSFCCWLESRWTFLTSWKSEWICSPFGYAYISLMNENKADWANCAFMGVKLYSYFIHICSDHFSATCRYYKVSWNEEICIRNRG